mmetsp:Transcript_169713/g.544639  ORF Transcript_169713/g.544639 Transcript_169713/m.544639 type:complete len:411 (-) Transcript_169713:172-1404(-)
MAVAFAAARSTAPDHPRPQELALAPLEGPRAPGWRRKSDSSEALVKGLLLCASLASAAASASRQQRPAQQQRRLGRRQRSRVRRSAGAGVELPELAIGTWAWGNRLLWQYTPEMDDDLRRAFELCVERGACFFDTGDTYGTGDLDGRSESLLGQFDAGLPAPLPWPLPSPRRPILATKWAPKVWMLSRESLVESCKRSIGRMGRVDVGQLHWPPAFFHESQLLDGLGDVYEQGLVKGVGLSNYGPQGLRRVVNRLAERGVPVATAQVQFSLLTENNDAFVETCLELGVKPIAYSPLCLGLLSGKYNEEGATLPPPPRGWLLGALSGDANFKRLLGVLDEIGKGRGKTRAQVAINWCVCKGAMPLVGVKNVIQAEENLGAIGWRLSDNEVLELDRASRAAPKTQPNPVSVP